MVILLSFDNFSRCLNNTHPSIRFTFEKFKTVLNQRGETLQKLIFVDVIAVLNKKNRKLITDIYHKRKNAHHCLPSASAHPMHTKK